MEQMLMLELGRRSHTKNLERLHITTQFQQVRQQLDVQICDQDQELVHKLAMKGLEIVSTCLKRKLKRILEILERRAPVLPRRHEEGGKEVILLSVEKPFGQPVAMGTIQTTNPKARVGGAVLGNQYCEVVVNYVMRRNGLLPHPYGNIKTMADALGNSIAWPVKNLRDSEKGGGPSQDLPV